MRRFLALLFVYAAALAAVMLLLPSCVNGRADIPPQLRPEYDQALDALEAAKQTPDPQDDVDAVDWIVSIERQAIGEQAGPLESLLPYGLGAAVLEALKFAGSRRARRHYLNSVKSISRGKVMSAAGDVLKALGASHSNPEVPPPLPQPPVQPS